MFLSATTLKLLMDKGITGDDLVEIYRALEADFRSIEPPAPIKDEQAERRRAADRERKAQERLRKSAESAESAEPPRTGARVVIPSLPSLRSEELGGVGGVVVSAGEREIIPADDWPAGRASDHAELLVAAVASPWLDPNKSPDLVTTRGRVAAWKRDGASWEHDVLPIVTGLCANRRSKISTWKFFDEAVARSIAENRRALEIPQAGQVVATRATGPPRSFDEKSSAAWDYAERRIAEDG